MNRSIVWSLTQGGKVLNLHAAFRSATPELLDAFATLARAGGVRSSSTRRASAAISDWPGLADALRDARAANGRDDGCACCATHEQRRYLRAVHRYFNVTRFGGLLPMDLSVRLSNRMTSRLGHMLPGEDDEGGGRSVLEVALNVDLMLPGNGAERVDTMLHEMAHAADYLQTGHRGHGPSWQAWALRVGCKPARLYDRPIVSRARRRDAVTRVPPLPDALRALAD